MDDMYINYEQSGRTPRYTEIGPNGEIIYQSENIPAYVKSTYFHLYEPATPRNERKISQKTSDQYRTFGVPARFENPGIHIFPSCRCYKTILIYLFEIGGEILVNQNRMNSIEHQIKNMGAISLSFMICPVSIEPNQEHLLR